MSLAHSETFLTSVQAGVPIPFLRKHNLSSLLFKTSDFFGFEKYQSGAKENKLSDYGYTIYNGRCDVDNTELQRFNCRVLSASPIS